MQPGTYGLPGQQPQQQRTAEEDAALLAAVAPKKPAWDLKRDVAPKLAKLERRTRRAIVELVRDKAAAAEKAAAGGGE